MPRSENDPIPSWDAKLALLGFISGLSFPPDTSTSRRFFRTPLGRIMTAEELMANLGDGEEYNTAIRFFSRYRKEIWVDVQVLRGLITLLQAVVESAASCRYVPHSVLDMLQNMSRLQLSFAGPDGKFLVVLPTDLRAAPERAASPREQPGSNQGEEVLACAKLPEGSTESVKDVDVDASEREDDAATAQSNPGRVNGESVNSSSSSIPATATAAAGNRSCASDTHLGTQNDGDSAATAFLENRPSLLSPTKVESTSLKQAEVVLRDVEWRLQDLCDREMSHAISRKKVDSTSACDGSDGEKSFVTDVCTSVRTADIPSSLAEFRTDHEDALEFLLALGRRQDANSHESVLEFMKALERGLEEDVVRSFGEVRVVLGVVLHFLESIHRRLRAVMWVANTDESPGEEMTGIGPGAGRQEAPVGETWEAKAAKLGELAGSIERVNDREYFRQKVFRIRRVLSRSMRRMNERPRKTAASRRECENRGCLLFMDAVRYDCSGWLELEDKRELQLVCLETCKNVRLITPFSLHVSQPSFRSDEMHYLYLVEVERLTKSCPIEHDNPARDEDGRCQQCVAIAWQNVVQAAATPRWVWFRQSTAHRSQRRSKHPPLAGKGAGRQGPVPSWSPPPPSAASRVPPLLVTRMTWSYLFRDLDRGRALPPQLEHLTLGAQFNHSLDNFTWPSRLKSLTLGAQFTCSLDGPGVLPATLEEIHFGHRFNRAVDKIEWPAGLRQITFSSLFNQPLSGVTWPLSLRVLSFGRFFNQPIIEVAFPADLEELYLGERYRQPLIGCELPKGLRKLHAGGQNDHDIRSVRWPEGMTHIDLGWQFAHPLDGVTWPPTLEYLRVGNHFNHPIDAVSWPPTLKTLELGFTIAQRVDHIAWPPALERLSLGRRCFHLDGSPVTGPPWLKSLVLYPVSVEVPPVDDAVAQA